MKFRETPAQWVSRMRLMKTVDSLQAYNLTVVIRSVRRDDRLIYLEP